MHSKKRVRQLNLWILPYCAGRVFPWIERVKKEKLRKAWQGNIPCRALRSFSPNAAM